MEQGLTIEEAITEALNGFVPMTPWLWWLSLTFFGIADLITTGAAVMYSPVAEGSPVVEWMLRNQGIGGLVLLKLLEFAFGYAVWRSIPSPHNVGVPLAYAVMGIGLTTWNLFVLSVTMSG